MKMIAYACISSSHTNDNNRSEWRLKTHSSGRNGDLKPISMAEITAKNQNGMTMSSLLLLKGFAKMDKISFKERVRQTVITCSKKYKNNFVDYDYLVCSKAFYKQSYYIISAHEDNYQHLTGVHSLISPQEFFKKCYDGSLSDNDFDFIKKGQSEKSVKGSVREKIAVLDNTMDLFTYPEIYVEESFHKNRIVCSFATAVNSFTLGFASNKYATPKSLLKNNQLNNSNDKVDLIIRKRKSEEFYSEIIFANTETIKIYYNKIKHLLSHQTATALSQHCAECK